MGIYTVLVSSAFAAWFDSLRDDAAKKRIGARIKRLEVGNEGDSKSVGGGVKELRIDWGPGYRVYYVRRGEITFLLLCAGDKRTQSRDIATAIEMVKAQAR